MISDLNPNLSFSPLLIVIVNYRTAHLTIGCLHSLVEEVQALPGTRVAVVDNASGDNSVELIQSTIETEGWKDWVSFLPQEKNGGFSFGNNAAIRPALQSEYPPEYILLLNPDTTVYSGSIQTLVQFMNQHSEVGIAGASQEFSDGTVLPSAFRFHTIFSELDNGLKLGIVSKLLNRWVVAPPVSEVSHSTDWVSGGCMMIRRQVFDQIGLMDEEYFLYYEEMDFCLQAKRAGWQCWYVAESRIVHLGGQSSGVTGLYRKPQRRPQYWFESRRRYFIKNYGVVYAALVDIIWAIAYSLWQIRRAIQRKPDEEPPQLLNDFIKNSIFVRRLG